MLSFHAVGKELASGIVNVAVQVVLGDPVPAVLSCGCGKHGLLDADNESTQVQNRDNYVLRSGLIFNLIS